jgi:uncharacterized protein (TIGR02186 family)
MFFCFAHIVSLFFLLVSLAEAGFDITLDLSKDILIKNAEFKNEIIKISGLTNQPYDLILKVKGPSLSYRMSKKVPQYGLWVKKDKLTIPAADSYLYISSNKPLNTITDDYTLNMLGLTGKVFKEKIVNLNPQQNFDIEKEFCVYSEQKGLYLQRPGKLETIAGKFYRDEIPIPERASSGIYEVVVYGFLNGVLVAQQTNSFVIKKQEIYSALDELYGKHPLFYAFLSIAIALISGFIAAFIFAGHQKNNEIQ